MTGKNKNWYQVAAKQIGILSWSIYVLEQLVRTKTDIDLWPSGYSFHHAIAKYIAS